MTCICEKCLDGTPYVTFAREHGTRAKCTYCRCIDPNTYVISYDMLLSHLQEIVQDIFQEDVGEFNDDDGEPVVQLYESYDIVEFLGLTKLNDELCEQLHEEFEDNNWIKVDPMAPSTFQVQSIGWSRFKEIVKHSHRYTFSFHSDVGKSEDDPEHIQIRNVPNMLLAIAKECVCLVPQGTRMCRVQEIGKDEPKPPEPTRMTSPPENLASQPNRMSPAGVPMFYGASDFDTAQKETIDLFSLTVGEVYGLEFETVQEMPVLDLTKSYGSIHYEFQKRIPEDSPYYEDEFLAEFAKDVSKTINSDGRQHIDYVPTQVFTEYVRYLMKTKDGEPIQGIKYTSSKTGEPCFVIFATQAQCLDSDTPPEDGPQLLRPIPSTLKHWKLALEECK